MRKWKMMVVVGLMGAGFSAEAFWPFGSGRSKQEEPSVEWRREDDRRMRGPEGERPRPQPSEEQLEKMRAEREEINALSEAYRSETDPAKQEAIKAQLREKLADIANRMEAMHRRRVEEIRGEVQRMEERIEESRKNREARIDEQVERILSGEAPLLRREGGGPRPGGPARRPGNAPE